MSETPYETDAEREARQDAELRALEGQTPADQPTTPAGPNAGVADAEGDAVASFVVDGTFPAEDQHDAYKLLQAHFLALSRGDAGTLQGVSVEKA